MKLMLIALLMAGCGSAPPAPSVKVPVYTSCVKVTPSRPDFESKSLPAGASPGQKVLAIARDMPRHFKYEGELEAVIAGCL